MKPIFVINGPNLNLLGTREPDIYGPTSLADIESLCAQTAQKLGFDIIFEQSNHEGVLVDLIQKAGQDGSAIVINPAAYTHTSIALLDAIKSVDIPTIEVHLSQPARREAFRHISYVAMAAEASISGLGALSYVLGLEAAVNLVKHNTN